MTGPGRPRSVEPEHRPTPEAALRAAVTAAFCSFLMIKLAAPEVFGTSLSIRSQLVLLLMVLSLAAVAARWFARRPAARRRHTSA